MVTKRTPQVPKITPQAREMPQSLKTILEKMPAPEAVKVFEDIMKSLWDNNNNNNNNNTESDLAMRFLDKLSVMPNTKLREILEFKG